MRAVAANGAVAEVTAAQMEVNLQRGNFAAMIVANPNQGFQRLYDLETELLALLGQRFQAVGLPLARGADFCAPPPAARQLVMPVASPSSSSGNLPQLVVTNRMSDTRESRCLRGPVSPTDPGDANAPDVKNWTEDERKTVEWLYNAFWKFDCKRCMADTCSSKDAACRCRNKLGGSSDDVLREAAEGNAPRGFWPTAIPGPGIPKEYEQAFRAGLSFLQTRCFKQKRVRGAGSCYDLGKHSVVSVIMTLEIFRMHSVGPNRNLAPYLLPRFSGQRYTDIHYSSLISLGKIL